MSYVSSAERFGIEKGRKEGLEKGRQEGLEKVAMHLLKDGAKPPYVAKITGLSLAKIKELQLKLKKKHH